MFPACMLLDIMMCLACNTFMERYLTKLDSYFFIKLMPEIKVTVAAKLNICTALRDPKMFPQTKFGIPMSNNVGFMLVTRFF